jgi:hypothetical protein
MLDGSWVTQGSWTLSGWETREEKMAVSWSWQRTMEHWGARRVALQMRSMNQPSLGMANGWRMTNDCYQHLAWRVCAQVGLDETPACHGHA